MILAQRILGLSLKVLLNHRGSGMNLRFQLIHRVLTREFLSKIKKIRIKPHSIQIKNQSKEKEISR